MLVLCCVSGCGREVDVISSTTSPTSAPTATAPAVQPAAPTPTHVNGQVSSVAGACPTLRFTVSGTAITTAQATDVDGGCGAIINGATVSVRGTLQSDGSVAAARVTVQPIELADSISSLRGSCPALMFSLSGTEVTTDASTRFTELRCPQLTNGTTVTVQGYRQSDGSVKATSVESRGPGQP